MPERPWQEIIDAQVAASIARERAPRKSTAVNMTQLQYEQVLAAARERDISMAAYLRRSCLSFAQYDTGFDWLRVMEDEPATGSFGNTGGLRDLHGLGAGAWKIETLHLWQ